MVHNIMCGTLSNLSGGYDNKKTSPSALVDEKYYVNIS